MILKNKRILITGGASGIGRELALHLSKDEKCLVYALDANKTHLQNFREKSAKLGLSIETIYCDITDYENTTKTLNKLLGENKIDIWFNNAGVVSIGEYSEQTTEQINRMIQVNFQAVCHWTHFALKKMSSSGGVVVNMASFSGLCPAPYISLYSACKHGVVGLTRSLQEELTQTNSLVKLVLVSPGFIKTPLIANNFPKKLQWLLASPTKTARAIIKGLKKDKSEIIPDVNGKVLKLGHRLIPRTLLRSAKLLRKMSQQ